MRTQLSILAILASTAAYGQEIVDLPEISLTANLSETEISRTGASVIVIDEEEIADATQTTVADYLAQTAGVSMEAAGGIGGIANVSIRGARSEYVPVFIDGINVTDPSAPKDNFNFGSMTMSGISRIEILKGSQSALYGGSAVGGVIAITTKGADRDGFSGSAAIEAGSFDSYAGSATLAHRGASHDITLGYSYRETEGFSAAEEADGNTEADGFTGERLSLNVIYDISETTTVGLAAFGATSTADTDGYDPVTYAFGDDQSHYDEDKMAGRAFWKYDDGTVSHELALSRLVTDRDYSTPSADYNYQGTRDTVEYAMSLNATDAMTINIGGEISKTESSQAGDYGDSEADATTTSIYAGMDYAVTPDFDLSLNVRTDNHSAFGTHTTWRAAAVYRPEEGLAIRAVASTGYRAPSLNELYAPFYGNQDLQVETSTSYELGIEKSYTNGARLGATVFQLITTDLIGFDPITYVSATIEGESRRRGIEIDGSLPMGNAVTFNAAYAYIETEDAAGLRLPRIPTHELNIGVDAQITDELTANLSAKMVRDLVDSYETPMDDYNVVNARLGYALGNGEVYARVENLFDEQYQTVDGYGTSDRAYYVGYSVDF